MIVPLAPLASGSFPSMSRAACCPTRNALNAEFRRVSSTITGSASITFLRKMPGTRPSMLCTTSLGVPTSWTTLPNNCATAAGSLASQAYRRTPCDFSRVSRTAFSGFLAAPPTRMPLCAPDLDIGQRIPGLLKRKDLIHDWTDHTGFNQGSDLAQLLSLRTHEQE